MKKILTFHLYIIGFLSIIFCSIKFNWNLPPSYDEAHAWNIAEYLSPIEILSIAQSEGHPFLWYYLLLPLAKINFLYPYSLYTLNLIVTLGALFFLYKYAPLPTSLKYLITFSYPIIRLYASFARSYSLIILIAFILLSLYPQRHQKRLPYLSLLILLANVNVIGFMIAAILGFLYFLDISRDYKNDVCTITPIYQIIVFTLIECVLLIIQFSDYNRDITTHTPVFIPLIEDLNRAYTPLNFYIFSALSAISLLIFLKNKRYYASIFLVLMYIGLSLLFKFIYHGTLHHHYFYYISLISAYWIANIENKKLSRIAQLPLYIIAFALIFTPDYLFDIKDRHYLTEIRSAAYEINRIADNKPIEIYTFSNFEANIMLPYLDKNITIKNQNMTDFKNKKSIGEALIHLYQKINILRIVNQIRENPETLLLKKCGEQAYQNTYLTMHLKHKLNDTYCLYSNNLN